MADYKVIDFENWPRKEHYIYYTKKLKVGYSMTVSLDVTHLVAFCKKNKLKFYPVFIYCTACVINRTDTMRMFTNNDGKLCVWNYVVPNYTVFHNDDFTFSDLWSDFSFDFNEFYTAVTHDMCTYKDIKGIKGKKDQPPNFFCISCVPWVTFTSYHAYSADSTPSLFPIITYGKYIEENGRLKMPFNLVISHAACDGYHTSKFFCDMQKEIEEFAENK